jgi:hypothetical protein
LKGTKEENRIFEPTAKPKNRAIQTLAQEKELSG